MSDYKFNIGDIVEWYSSDTKKVGEIVSIVPAHYKYLPLEKEVMREKEGVYRSKWGGGNPRDHESYIISVQALKKNGSPRSFKDLYWPKVSLLKKV